MVKHVTIKLTILLLLLLLLAMTATVVSAQTPSGQATSKNAPQVTVPAQPDGPTLGQISHQFKIQPKPKKSDQVDLGKVIMQPASPYKVYTDPQFDLNWFRKDHPALALDFKIKDK